MRTQRQVFGTVVKLPLRKLVFYIEMFSSGPWVLQIPASHECAPWEAIGDGSSCSACYPSGRHRLSFCFLTWAWPSPDCSERKISAINLPAMMSLKISGTNNHIFWKIYLYHSYVKHCFSTFIITLWKNSWTCFAWSPLHRKFSCHENLFKYCMRVCAYILF